MLIMLSCHTVICQSVAEVQLTGVTPLGAVSYRFIIIIIVVIAIPPPLRHVTSFSGIRESSLLIGNFHRTTDFCRIKLLAWVLSQLDQVDLF